MKKRICQRFLCLFLLISLLCACHSIEPCSNSDSRENETYSTPTLYRLFPNRRGAGTEAGFYYVESLHNGEYLAYIDYATKQQLPLCAAPNCAHEDESCTAWLGEQYAGFVAVWNNKLYALETSCGQKTPAALWEMELNGENRRLVYKFDASSMVTTENQFASSNTLYLNFSTIHNINGEVEFVPHTIAYTPGEKCKEISPILQPEDTLLMTMEDKLLVSRRSSLYVTDAGKAPALYQIDMKGQAKKWQPPTLPPNCQMVKEYLEGSQVYLDSDGHLLRQEYTTGEIIDYGILPFLRESTSLYILYDGNLVFTDFDEKDREVCYLVTPDGWVQSPFSYYADDFGRRSSILNAHVGEEHYLILSKYVNFNHSEYQIISKEDYWAGLDTGEVITLVW